MSQLNDRRAFMRRTAYLLAATHACRWLGGASAAEAAPVVVDTSAGRIRGFVNRDVSTFKGVPYGASTAGKNRFMPPVKMPAWSGTRDATSFGPTAPQAVLAESSPPVGEDCLVLNVFSPGVGDRRKRPVMVWLHGGGFRSGSGSAPILDGTNLAHSHDVVVVTLNHRLNVFGFTYLAEAAGADFASSAAVGMLDIVAALEWVRDNIERFGGDPNLVTIFGQSGGGRKVATLMSMPSAKGLFHLQKNG
jgi:para-nitrobenzyl esterase